MAKRTISTEEDSPSLLKILVLCELTARRLMWNFSAISLPNNAYAHADWGVPHRCYYWTSSSHPSGYAYCFYMYCDENRGGIARNQRNFGCSVRLVQDVQ